MIWSQYRWNFEKLKFWKVNEFSFLNEEIDEFTSMRS